MRLVCGIALVCLFSTVCSTSAQDLDSTEVKIFLNTLVETAGQAISGGVLWSANTHGGFPHLTVGVGLNLTSVSAVNPATPGETLAAAIPTIFVYGSAGILKGLNPNPMVGGIGSVDLVGRFGQFPTVGDYKEYAEMTPALFGGGVKVGVFRNSLIAPAISMTFTYTRTSQMMYVFSDTTADAWVKLKLSALSLHGDISKDILLFTPYAGIGVDWHSFDASWNVDFINPLAPDESGSMTLTPTSTRLYAGVQLSLVVLHFNLEGGMTGGNLFVAAGTRVGI